MRQVFEAEFLNTGWFDETAIVEGWYDQDFGPGGIQLRASSTAGTSGANAGSLNITIPSSVQANDLILLVGSKNATGATWTTPSGFTLWQSITDGVETTQGVVYYKVSDGSEGGTSATIDPSTTNTGIGAVCLVFKNVDPADPIDTADTTGAWNVNATGPDPTTNAITTDHNGAALVHLWERTGSRAGYTVAYDSALGVIGENNYSGATVEQTLFAAWELKGVAGTSTARTLDTTGSTNITWDAVIALRDVATAGGGSATFDTLVGTATAAGGSTSLTGDAGFATVAGSATADGGSTTFGVSVDFTTTVGDATASGGSTSMSGDAGFATTASADAASGGSTTLTGDAAFSTTATSDTASGGSTSFAGDANFSTVVGVATADGGSTSLSGEAEFVSTVGTATASGGSTTATGDANFDTVVGVATAAGGVTTFDAGSSATFDTTVGTATASGGSTSLSGDADFSTTVGSATASGGSTTFDATVNATFTTLAGSATASGEATAFVGNVLSAVFETMVGTARTSGGVSYMFTDTQPPTTESRTPVRVGGNWRNPWMNKDRRDRVGPWMRRNDK
jgi:hypothetical protein